MTEPTEASIVPKRIGGSLALFLPADLVKKGGIKEGVPVRIAIRPEGRSRVLGALRSRRRPTPFDRHEEGLWPDE